MATVPSVGEQDVRLGVVDVVVSPSIPHSAPRPIEAPQPSPAPINEESIDWLQRGQIPSLNGLRACSIAIVLFSHMADTPGFPIHGTSWGLQRLGSFGVDMFFVISGFLITLLMLRERDKTSTVSLRAFYIRRCFRILPAYLGFLAFVFALSLAGWTAMRGRDWAAVLTYTINFMPNGDWPVAPVGHTWSLSVEEHFYLLWPAVFVFLPRRAALGFALGLISLSPIVRFMVFRNNVSFLEVDYSTPTRLDMILAGCVLALMTKERTFLRWAAPLARKQSIWLVPALLVAALLSQTVLSQSGKYYLLANKLVLAACFVGILWLTAANSSTRWAKFLNWSPIVWVGLLSYSLYLWQQPFLFHGSDFAQNEWLVHRFPWNLGVTLLCAMASYFLIESPLLRWRERRGWGKAG